MKCMNARAQCQRVSLWAPQNIWTKEFADSNRSPAKHISLWNAAWAEAEDGLCAPTGR